MNNVDILIVGQGHVGKALANRLKYRGTVHTYDTKYDPLSVLESYKKIVMDAVVIAVDLELKFQDQATAKLQALLDYYDSIAHNALFVIASTVHPEMVGKLRFRNPTVLLPEFFTATNLDQGNIWERVVLGVDDKQARRMAYDLLDPVYFPSMKLQIVSMKEAALIKLATNAYLAMRVTYMNSLADMAADLGCDALAVLSGVTADERIGEDYARPSFAYSGPCLPMSVDAIIGPALPMKWSTIVPEYRRLFSTAAAVNQIRVLNLREAIIKLVSEGKRVGFNRIGFAPGAKDTKSSHFTEVMTYVKTVHRSVEVHFYDDDVADVADSLYRCASLDALFQCVDVIFSEEVIDPELTESYPDVLVIYPWTLRQYLIS